MPASQRRAYALSMVRDVDLAGLAAAASTHGIAGYVRSAVGGSTLLPPDEAAALEDGYRGALATHLRTVGELGTLRPALDEIGPWLVVKGPVLAETVHARPDLRGYGDLDVLVRPSALGDALEALEAAGAEILDRNWTLLARELRGEVHARLRHGTTLDLHWHLLNERTSREAFRLPVTEMLERRRTVSVGPLKVPTLDAEDTLLHLGLHTLLSGGHRLVWFKDVERAVAQRAHDWDELIRRARAWRVDLVVGMALERARTTAGAAVPAEVISALARSRSWRALAGAAAWLAPVERQSGRGSVTRMLSRSTRDTAGSSFAVLARKAMQQARRRERLVDRARDANDAANPGSMLHASGDRATRESFLAAVSREDARDGPG